MKTNSPNLPRAHSQLARVMLLLLATTAMAQQETSLADQAKQALRNKKADASAPNSSQPSLAEEAQKALQAPPAADAKAADDPGSLGEQARRIAQEHKIQRGMQSLRHHWPRPYEIAVLAPPGMSSSEPVLASSRSNRGATPASQQFSLSGILRRKQQVSEPPKTTPPLSDQTRAAKPMVPSDSTLQTTEPAPRAVPPSLRHEMPPSPSAPVQRVPQPAQMDAALSPPPIAPKTDLEPKPAELTSQPPPPVAHAPAPAPILVTPPAQPANQAAAMMPAAPPAQPAIQPVPMPQQAPSVAQVQVPPPAPVIAPVTALAAPVPAPPLQQSKVTAALQPTVTSSIAPAQAPPLTQADSSTILAQPGLNIQTDFKVKYVGQDVVYLVGGRSAGLTQGAKLTIKRRAEKGAASDIVSVAEIEVSSLAATSAVAEVKSSTGEIKVGDIAYMSEADAEVLAQTRAMGSGRKYPQVITFTEGDPLEEEARAELPRPPLPEVNRARGRIGLDYSGLSSHGTIATNSYQLGGVVRADITRINGTYWSLSGYWRGRLNNSSTDGQATLQDLINRTYHLSMTYDNPKSSWVAGFGRLYLPWASSLDTLDGGYVGRRLGHGITTGLFAGSTPDPSSWDYNPDRRIGGVFINFEGGSFENVHYTSTSGVALSSLGWILDRPFVFFENGIFFKRYFSIYESAQADDPRPVPGVAAAGAGLSRSFLTIRFQPHKRISFDVNHNYFRDVPTFSQQLISTGLVDKYLFQGFSAGVRVEPVRHVTLYTDLGRSDRTGDAKSSINQLYGITWDHIWKTGLRADLRASKFDGSFGSGSYRSLALSRNFGTSVHWQIQAGRQTLVSSFTSQGSSRFINSSVDATFARHYFLQGDYTTQRGTIFDYDQWILTFGYRFDNRTHTGGTQ